MGNIPLPPPVTRATGLDIFGIVYRDGSTDEQIASNLAFGLEALLYFTRAVPDSMRGEGSASECGGVGQAVRSGQNRVCPTEAVLFEDCHDCLRRDERKTASLFREGVSQRRAVVRISAE